MGVSGLRVPCTWLGHYERGRRRGIVFYDQIHEVEIEVRAHRGRRVTLDPDIGDQIVKQARIRGVSPETLVNLWLMERVQAQV